MSTEISVPKVVGKKRVSSDPNRLLIGIEKNQIVEDIEVLEVKPSENQQVRRKLIPDSPTDTVVNSSTKRRRKKKEEAK